MKKVKIMLLSLALFAVVGAALAFKAKFEDEFCVTNAYNDPLKPVGQKFYCSFTFDNQGVVNTTTTTCGNVFSENVEEDINVVNPDLKILCTSNDVNEDCQRLCPIKTSIIPDI